MSDNSTNTATQNNLLAKGAANGGTSLQEHIRDVATIAKIVAKGYGAAEAEIELAFKAGLLHDIGKAHPLFQQRLRQDSHIVTLQSDIPLRHEICSLLFLSLFPMNEWDALIEYIVAHHKSVGKNEHSRKGIVMLCEEWGEDDVFDIHSSQWGQWSLLAMELLQNLDIAAKSLTIDDARKAFDYTLSYCENITKTHRNEWSWRKGILVSADHYVSALNGVGETNKLFCTPDTSYFASRTNTLYPLSLVDAQDIRPHTLVKAPTGAGKTDYLMRRCKGRIFYTLPFQASINAMYARFKKVMEKDDVRLLHASSSFKADSLEERVLQEHCGAGVKVLTPHQLAALATGTRGFEAVAVDVAGCDIILDEIHCYRDDAQAMVLEVVRVLIKLGCRIHLGSATMPSEMEKALIELMGGESKVYTVALPDNILDSFNRHISHKHDSFEETVEIIKAGLGNNEKIIIVCNRVDAAQARYKALKELRDEFFPHVRMVLIHSRFKRGDRAEKEEQLMELFDSPTPCLVVATQVVEVSLDISADRMITDCAPLDALVQRFGRVHRKRNEATIGTYKNVHVIAPPENARDAKPYNLETLQRSFEQLPKGELFRETELQTKLDVVYPHFIPDEREVHFVWRGDHFKLPMLCHLPKSYLLELLNIDSQTLILKGEEEKYRLSNADTRKMLEIPVPSSTIYKKFTGFGRLDYGSRPFVGHDDLYSKEYGFEFAEIEQYI